MTFISKMTQEPIPLVVHLIYRLDFGGLETLLVECVNGMPADQYRHAIVCLTGYTDFAQKITQANVQLFSLDKAPGLGLGTHLKLWKLLRQLRPTILHTYNLSAIEYALTASLAGVPVRIHAEHGRDAGDPDGKNKKHNLLRKLLVPFVDCYVPVSGDLQRWLKSVVGIPDAKNRLINNGVDTNKFSAHQSSNPQPEVDKATSLTPLNLPTIFPPDSFVIGTVGRVQDVKNHATLVDAFIQLQAQLPADKSRMRLVIIGDGPLRPALINKINEAGISDVVWLPGARSDIAEIMQTFSVFVLPSIAEGTPVTMLEAMSCGLPIVATRVGGIPELVVDHVTGTLVAPNDTNALTNAIAVYLQQPELISLHGTAGRKRIKQYYSINAMLAAYTDLYNHFCHTKLKSI
ncbi:sugar transferase (PEP-CTERM/EpsH1 system associated) [Undibacterium sp. GrIS 1.8]|uniref:TIGR03088 family PEP-CTERM/XrtA system glycosyltransferase n=1 Tax=unclassified Undibacterium TaxID=2630295 RepID=UPI003396598C